MHIRILNKILILSIVFLGVINANGQELSDNLLKVKGYNKSIRDIESDLVKMSSHFSEFNKENKTIANELLTEILTMTTTLKKGRNQFLLMAYPQFDTHQRELVKNRITWDLNYNDHMYNELVSIYRLKDHYTKILLLVKPNILDEIKAKVVTDQSISDNNVQQLNYISTLVNISNSNEYRDSILLLVEDLYKHAKKQEDVNVSRRMLTTLYGNILPNTIGKILSRDIVFKTLYLIDDPIIFKYGDDVGDANLAYIYVSSCILPKLSNSDSKYWRADHFYQSIELIKKELKNDDQIWLERVKLN